MRQDIGNLMDSIVLSVRLGELPRQFRKDDIRRVFGDRFAEKHIDTVLANYAECGNMVIRGQRARFRRISKGLYEIL